MKKIHLPLLVIVALFVSSCGWPGIRGNGRIKTEQRPVTEFSDIQAGGMYQIEWHPGAPSLSISTDENLLPYIESSVDGKSLKLESRDQIHPTRRIKVLVTSPTLTGANLSGAVRFNATQLTGPKFYLDTSGACHIVLAGNVDDLLGEMSGATKLEAEDLHTKNTDISSSGASKAEVHASETLRVSISGAGKVTYYGHPKVERHISGAGSIKSGD